MNPLFPPGAIIMIFAAVGAVAGMLSFRSAQVCGVRTATMAAAARVLGIATLSIPLLNPGWWKPRETQRDSSWIVLADRSGSMQIEDAGDRTRWEEAARLAEHFAAEAKAAGEKAVVEVFDVRTGMYAPNLQPDGTGTDLDASLEETLFRHAGGKSSVAGIIVLSDGRQSGRSEMGQAVRAAQAAQAPVYCVPLGGTVAIVDLAVTTARGQYTVFRGQNQTVQATIHSENGGRRECLLRLRDGTGKVVEEKPVRLTENQDAVVSFGLPQLEAGLYPFTVEADVLPEERRPENNAARFRVHVVDEAIRVLLVEGAPYWDTKFIAQLLQREKSYQFEVVYRLTDKRFFRVDGDETESEFGKSETVFPQSMEELSKYDLIIFGRSVEGFLDPARVAMLKEWVTVRGGALLFARGKPVSTDIPELDPLYPGSWDAAWRQEYAWRPSVAGEDAGLFDGELPKRDAAIWTRLPQLREAMYGNQLKPFAQVLVEGVSSSGGMETRFPAIVARRTGEGMVVSVNTTDLWRWDFIPRVEEAKRVYRDFWFQLFNWMVAYSDFLPGKNYAMRLNRMLVDAGVPVKARVLRRPIAAEAGAAEPKLFLTNETGDRAPLALNAVAGNANAWETIFSVEQPGTFLLEVEPEQEDQRVYATLRVRGKPAEMDEVSADPAVLEKIAEATGGKIISENDFAGLLRSDHAKPVPASGAAHWQSAWDTPMVLLLMLVFFGTEWVLRRRQGLI